MARGPGNIVSTGPQRFSSEIRNYNHGPVIVWINVNYVRGDGERAQWLRTFAALQKDWFDLLHYPGFLTTACDYGSRGSESLF